MRFSRYMPTVLASAIGIALVAALLTAIHSGEMAKVTVGTNDVVYYMGTGKDRAVALGKALRDCGYFTDRGFGAILTVNRASRVVAFPLNDGAWQRPDAVTRYGELGRRIGPAIGGFPLQVRLLDTKLVPRRNILVGKETIGTRDTIFYYGTATRSEALALGHMLQESGAMRDAGLTVVLAKGDATVVSFVVHQKPWEQPEVVAVYESLLRHVASSVGGLPLTLRFLDTTGVMRQQFQVL